MSEVSDYEKKVKTLSYAQLQDELKKWKAQQAEATGEYGYWGGVTGQEIVDAELERRSGKEYVVVSDFVDDDGILRKKGTAIMENQLTTAMLEGLCEHYFVKAKDE